MKLNPIILSSLISLLSPILQNPVPCGADGLLGDAHDVAHALVVHAHFVEDEEENLSLAVNLNILSYLCTLNL